MKKILSLIAVFVFALSVNAYADVHDQADDLDRHQQKMTEHKKYKEHIENLPEEEKKALRSKIRMAKEKCASQCNVNRSELQQCRKKLEESNIKTTKSSCLKDQDRTCMKSCMKQAKATYKDKHRGSY